MPHHDFHTSWLTMTYNEKNKAFDMVWRTDTEHLETVLNDLQNREIYLENTSVENHIPLINKYIQLNTTLYINAKKQLLSVELIEVTFAETIIHFKPLKYRKKIKSFSMENTLLQKQFPNQKNMVQLNYRGKVSSMLLGEEKTFDRIVLQ